MVIRLPDSELFRGLADSTPGPEVAEIGPSGGGSEPWQYEYEYKPDSQKCNCQQNSPQDDLHRTRFWLSP